MNVLVIFPKPQCYDLKDTGVQRTYRQKFIQYLEMLVSNGCGIDVLLEDKLANSMMASIGQKPRNLFTCISKSDLDWVEKYPDTDQLNADVFNMYNKARPMLFDSESKFTVSLTVMKEGKAAYFNKRVKAYHNRYKYTIDKLVSTQKNIMQFRVGNSMDRGIAVKSTVAQGDGRLCIEIGINEGYVASYYGGVFIEENTLPMILTL